jgi:hypothetical protein
LDDGDVVHDLPVLEPVTNKNSSLEMPSPIAPRKRPMLSKASSMYFKDFMKKIEVEDH